MILGEKSMVFEVARHGTSFATRPRGAELRESLVMTATGDEDVVVDFGGVLAVSSSFGDEFLGELAATRTVTVVGASDEVARVLDRVLDRRGLTARSR